jgi:cytochrome c-type biogenesis protein
VTAAAPIPSSIGEWFASTAFDGSLLLAVPVAMTAGAVSFFSPCVVPLLPGYLSYVTGLTGADLESAKRGRMLIGTSLFVLGFSAVFVALGALFGSLGHVLLEHQELITRVFGVVTILVGLSFIGLLPLLQRDVRVHRVPAVGLAAAPMLGVLFGLGWTPCIGPTLAAVLSLAANGASLGRGVVLTFAYSLGLGIPFIVAGLAFRRALGTLAFVRTHQVWVTRVGGAMLVAVGVLLLTGAWDLLIAHLREMFPGNTTTVV